MAEKKAKQYGRKYKSLLVIQYLLKHADEETPVSTIAIQKHLDKYGIDADRHSIYRDIYFSPITTKSGNHVIRIFPEIT